MNHLHCCHKIKAWVEQEYYQKRNRSPYREKSFQSTLRSYQSTGNICKSKNSSHISINTILFQEPDNKENKQTLDSVCSPLQANSIKQESATKDKILFRQIETGPNQTESLPFISGFPSANEFESIDIYTYQSKPVVNECIQQQVDQPSEMKDPKENEQQPSIPDTPHDILSQLLASSRPPKDKYSPRKFSVRIIKRQFRQLWSKDRIEDLCEAIIQTRRLCESPQRPLMKAKLYQLLIGQLI